MSIRQEYRQLRQDHSRLVDDHLRLTEDHHDLKLAHSHEVNRLLRQNQQQEAMLKIAEQMNQKLEGGLGKVMSLLERHLAAGENHVPAKALWHVLHNAGFTAAVKPEQEQKQHVQHNQAQHQAQKQEPKPEPKQQPKRQVGMRI